MALAEAVGLDGPGAGEPAPAPGGERSASTSGASAVGSLISRDRGRVGAGHAPDMWTSSGPSARRSVAHGRVHVRRAAMSSLTPAPPWTWMARSMTCSGHPGRDDLDRGDLAPGGPRADGVDQPRGLQRQQPGLLDGHARLGDPLLDDALLGERLAERHPRSRRARTSARAPAPPAPIARMQWWMRPGPSRAWAMRKPPPSSAMRFAAGTRTSVEAHLGVARAGRGSRRSGASARPRRRARPSGPAPSTAGGDGRSVGSSCPSGSTPCSCGSAAPVIHHLRPLIT